MFVGQATSLAAFIHATSHSLLRADGGDGFTNAPVAVWQGIRI